MPGELFIGLALGHLLLKVVELLTAQALLLWELADEPLGGPVAGVDALPKPGMRPVAPTASGHGTLSFARTISSTWSLLRRSITFWFRWRVLPTIMMNFLSLLLIAGSATGHSFGRPRSNLASTKRCCQRLSFGSG